MGDLGLITNLKSKFKKLKWQIQYGSQIEKKIKYVLFTYKILYVRIF